MEKAATKNNDSTANIGFEAKLWLAADKLRNNMDAAEYKHVVLGLIFIKYISNAFEEMRAKLIAGKGEYEGSDPEDADEYRAENVFWGDLRKQMRSHPFGDEVIEGEIIEGEVIRRVIA